jgi:hypothetical protein
MDDVNATRQKPGRPRTPPETHRTPLMIRLRPAVRQSLEAAAAAAHRTLSREVEMRIETYDQLIGVLNVAAPQAKGLSQERRRAVIEAVFRELVEVMIAFTDKQRDKP